MMTYRIRTLSLTFVVIYICACADSANIPTTRDVTVAVESDVKLGYVIAELNDSRARVATEDGHPEEGAEGGEHEETDHNSTHEEHEEHEVHRYHVAKFDFDNVSTNLIVSIWILFVSGAKIAFHTSEKLSRFFPESCILIVIGVILGIILYFTDAGSYQLNTHTFFLIILPPIILDAGYYMPARSFFDNLGTIVLYAVLGTLLNCLFLGFSLWGVYEGGGFEGTPELPLLHCLTLAALLAAVDPVAVLAVFEAVQVNEVLYIVVFGESLLNDGISVVLYRMFEGFSTIGAENIIGLDIFYGILSFFVIVIGSPSMGILFGFLAGFVSRFTHHAQLMEPLLIFVIGYVSYIFAEMFHLSGILSCTFCGITMRKYVEGRICKKSQTTIKYVMKVLAHVAEGIIFMYLGISAVNDAHEWNTGFILLTVVFCVIYRAVGVVVLTFFANCLRNQRLSPIDQFIMSYGGLRGAIAFALAALLESKIIPAKNLFVTTTVVVVYFTNICLGSTIQPLVTLLKIKKKDNTKPTMSGKIAERVFDHTMAGIESISGHSGYNRLRLKFSNFNNRYLKPLIIGSGHESTGGHRGHEIRNVYVKLTEKDAREIVKSPSYAADINRVNTFIKRQSSMSDMTRCGTETTLFNPVLWSLPSFTMEDRHRMTSVDHQSSLEQQIQRSMASAPHNDLNKTTRQGYYKKRTLNSTSSATCLTDSEMRDPETSSNGRPRRNASSLTDPDNVLSEESPTEIIQELEWHTDASAIQFTAKPSNGENGKSRGSPGMSRSTGEGALNPAFKPDDMDEDMAKNLDKGPIGKSDKEKGYAEKSSTTINSGLVMRPGLDASDLDSNPQGTQVNGIGNEYVNDNRDKKGANSRFTIDPVDHKGTDLSERDETINSHKPDTYEEISLSNEKDIDKRKIASVEEHHL